MADIASTKELSGIRLLNSWRTDCQSVEEIADGLAIRPTSKPEGYSLTAPKLLWIKGVLFALIGVISSVLLLLESPSLKVGLLLGLAVWAFCRAYYFAFYVIEHYVDPSYRFSGLLAFLGYVFRRRAQG